jgi:hypothetical protein
MSLYTRIRNLPCLVVCVICCFGCINRGNVDFSALRSYPFYKTENELQLLRMAAISGDGESAYSIYLHYSMAMGSEDAANEWLKMAAMLGSTNATRISDLEGRYKAAQSLQGKTANRKGSVR